MQDDPYKHAPEPAEVTADRNARLSQQERLLLLEFELRHLRQEVAQVSQRVVELRGQIRMAVDSFGNDIHATLDVLSKQAERHDDVLRGKNGEDGIINCVRSLNKQLDELREETLTRRRQYWALIVTAFGAVLSAVVAMIVK